MCSLLCSGMDHIVEREILFDVYLRNAPYDYKGDSALYRYDDWRLKSCFSRLAVLLTSSHYAYSALSGFVISAGFAFLRILWFLRLLKLLISLCYIIVGGLTESTRRNAADAVFTVVAQYRDSEQVFILCLYNHLFI